MNYGFLVRVQYASALSLVVAPCREKFGGKMVIRVACHFSDKGKVLCCDLFFDVGYIEEFLPRCLICDALLFHLSHIDA